MSKFLSSLLCDVEISALKIVKQITTFKILKNNEKVVRVLENIYHFDNVGVLAHFKNIYFLSLKLNFGMAHVLFLDRLNGHFLISSLVLSKLDNSELSLA